MNESIIIADNAVLHILIKRLSDAGVIDGLSVYQNAMDLLDALIDRETDADLKGALVNAGYYLLRTYVENELDDDEEADRVQ